MISPFEEIVNFPLKLKKKNSQNVFGALQKL